MSEVKAFIEKYQNDPLNFVKNCLGYEVDPFQEELLVEVGKGTRKLSLKSGHGTGKSTSLCWIIIWHLLFKFPQKTVVTAPSTGQLDSAVWADIKSMIDQLPSALRDMIEYTSERIYLKEAPNDSFINKKVSRLDNYDALQGVHSSGSVLLVVDEASGVHPKVFEASYGSMSTENARMILTGNPTQNSGYFYETFHAMKSEWYNITVSCLDSKRVSQSYINEMKAMYGEDSPVYAIRVLGEFAKTDDDTFIPFDLAYSAVERDVEPDPDAKVVWGVDVAHFGADKSALIQRKGNVLLGEPITWHRIDLMQLCGELLNLYDSVPERPSEVCIDAIGVGAGVVSRLQEEGRMPVRGVNVSESASLGQQYTNLRAELWGKAKEWLERKDCKILSPSLATELSTPKYAFASNGKMKIESKGDMRSRGIKSPDLADSFCLTFGSTPAIFAGATTIRWNEPIRRNLV